MSERAIMLPFSITPYGSIADTTDQSKIWADRVRSVIGTGTYERVMRTMYGTLIPYALFENNDEAEAEIRTEVERAFNAQLPLLSLTSVDATVDTITGTITIEIVYGLPNGEEVETAIGVSILNGDSPVIEVPL